MRKWCVGAIVMAMLAVPAFGACPNKCSGHGKCIKFDVCECMQNWTGGDCSGRVCPFTRAWHDTAEADDDAHYYAECGNRGVCDREKGVCECDEPFTGSGCRRLGCPSDCSGHGTCEFIEELAADGYYKRVGGVFNRKYTLWDQEKIMGCRCDPGFEGYNCAKRTCPKGDDPLTPDQNEMLQAIVLNKEGIKGFLTYHDPYGNAWTTETITFGTTMDAAGSAAACANIQLALRRLPNNVLNTITVKEATEYKKFTRSTGVLAAAITDNSATTQDKIICIVTFSPEPGTSGLQNLLECDISEHAVAGQHPKSAGTSDSAHTCLVVEVSYATPRPLTELAECSNRGVCDYSTGMCKCYTGHMGLACQTQEALV